MIQFVPVEGGANIILQPNVQGLLDIAMANCGLWSIFLSTGNKNKSYCSCDWGQGDKWEGLGWVNSLGPCCFETACDDLSESGEELQTVQNRGHKKDNSKLSVEATLKDE